MRVYSLKEEPGSPRYASALQTNYAFWQRGYEVISFERSQLSRCEFDDALRTEAEDILFYASVGVMNEVFERARKLFTGCIVQSERDLRALYDVGSHEAVFIQEVISMKSEWRATILRGEIINVAHYRGEPSVFPDREVMHSAVEKFDAAPWGYAMDWAVTDAGRTVLVEVNDGFGLGNYRVKGYLYTALLECRWRQIMGPDDNGVGG